MAFKQYVRQEIAADLDETYQFENWAADTPGRGYYDVHLAVIEEHETCVPMLRRVLQGRGMRILESGCGTGRWMAFFEQLGHRTIGIDDSAGPLGVAHAHDPSMRMARADARACPFPDASFDAVFSSYVAEHFEDGPESLLREIHRLLRPGGLLLIVVPYNSVFRRLFTNIVLRCYYLHAHWRRRPLAFTEFRFSKREMESQLRNAGFAVDHVEPDDFRLPWAKGLSLDLGPLVLAEDSPGSWELNRFGRVLAGALNTISPWICAAGIFFVARRV
jgi:SAM-dependent methyltransferase